MYLCRGLLQEQFIRYSAWHGTSTTKLASRIVVVCGWDSDWWLAVAALTVMDGASVNPNSVYPTYISNRNGADCGPWTSIASEYFCVSLSINVIVCKFTSFQGENRKTRIELLLFLYRDASLGRLWRDLFIGDHELYFHRDRHRYSSPGWQQQSTRPPSMVVAMPRVRSSTRRRL